MGKHARAFQKRVATSQIACRKDPATDTQISWTVCEIIYPAVKHYIQFDPSGPRIWMSINWILVIQYLWITAKVIRSS